MLLEIGNRAPINADGSEVNVTDPVVTYVNVPDSYTFNPDTLPSVSEFKSHLYDSLIERGGVTRLPDHEALLPVAHQDGFWRRHSKEKPIWLSCPENPTYAEFLSEFHECDFGRPRDSDGRDCVEDTHHTRSGPPGVGVWNVQLNGLVVNTGLSIIANTLGGFVVGTSGTATATGATSLSDSTQSWTTNQYANTRVSCSTAGVWGGVQSNSASVLTIDRWYAAATPGGAAGSTPASSATYMIEDGGIPSAWFAGVASVSSAASVTDTQLVGEYSTAGGGLLRKISTFAYSAGGATSYSLTAVFTANASDSLPYPINKVAFFNSMVMSTTISMMLEDVLGSTAQLYAIGDQLTLTNVVTI